MSGYIKATVNQNRSQTYTEIGKDGVIIYDGINFLKLHDSAGVEMVSRENFNSSNFYGWKVSSDGIYYCNGGTDWVKWDTPTATNIE